jgi:hypothetical protein
MQRGERAARLYRWHPEPCPEISEPLPYLIDPPGRMSSSAAWRRFRDDTLRPLIEARPDDRALPRFMEQAEAVLAWRETVPLTLRFWRAD